MFYYDPFSYLFCFLSFFLSFSSLLLPHPLLLLLLFLLHLLIFSSSVFFFFFSSSFIVIFLFFFIPSYFLSNWSLFMIVNFPPKAYHLYKQTKVRHVRVRQFDHRHPLSHAVTDNLSIAQLYVLAAIGRTDSVAKALLNSI